MFRPQALPDLSHRERNAFLSFGVKKLTTDRPFYGSIVMTPLIVFLGTGLFLSNLVFLKLKAMKKMKDEFHRDCPFPELDMHYAT